jgi:glutathione peroxidase
MSSEAHPIFPFLCESLSDSGAFGFMGNGIKWNFTKFLVDGEGVPVKRFGSKVHPLALEKDIVALIKKKDSMSEEAEKEEGKEA